MVEKPPNLELDEARQESARNDESRRILERVERESAAGSIAARTRRHILAEDADQQDPIELWGTRIGRAIAITTLAVFILWLLFILLAR